MSGTIGNTCNIITILPMNVECYAVNATSNLSSDGYINLIITGGTPPYTINWDVGGSGIFLNNLSYGSYGATITDFYGDYSENIKCTVGYNTVKVSKFEKCSGSTGEEVIYTTPINSLTTDYIYTFVEYDGCYKYTGNEFVPTTTIYSALTINEEYTDCGLCVIIPPSPEDQPSLCLTNNINLSYDFEPAGLDENENYYWSSTTFATIVKFNTNTSQWNLLNWSPFSSMIQNTTSVIPIGEWNEIGNNNITPWTMYIGPCGPIPLNININVTDTSCITDSDGSINIIANGGTPPYQYRIPTISLTWSNLPIFNNLPIGLYVAQVKDDNNEIVTSSFSVSNQQSDVDYEVSLTHTFTNLYNQGVIDFELNISPPLSNGDEILINTNDLKIIHEQTKRTGTDGGGVSFQYSYDITLNGNDIQFLSTPSVLNNNPVCDGKAIDTTEIFEANNNTQITISEGDVLQGQIVFTLDNFNGSSDCNCPMYANYGLTLELNNFDLVTNFNCVTDTLTNNIIIENVSLQDCSGDTGV